MTIERCFATIERRRNYKRDYVKWFQRQPSTTRSQRTRASLFKILRDQDNHHSNTSPRGSRRQEKRALMKQLSVARLLGPLNPGPPQELKIFLGGPHRGAPPQRTPAEYASCIG
eukprot:1781206-Amphidinium_carterae.1